MRAHLPSIALATSVASALAACGGGSPSVSYPYAPAGTVSRATSIPWEWLRDDPSLPAACGVQDNRWNEIHAPAGPRAERAFVEDVGGTPAFGWQWVWPVGGYNVVTYPEVVCGTKAWDMGEGGYTLGGDFPFQPSARALTVDYRMSLRSTGTHNVAFSLWAVSDTAHPLDTITNEIMIWVYNRGQAPAGALQGSVQSGATTFDVWVNPDQTDASGGSSAHWCYVAFVARKPLLTGPLDLSPLLDWLETHDLPGGAPGQRILPAGAWVGSLELGPEIVGGGGLVEVTGFDYALTDR